MIPPPTIANVKKKRGLLRTIKISFQPSSKVKTMNHIGICVVDVVIDRFASINDVSASFWNRFNITPSLDVGNRIRAFSSNN